MPLAGGIAPVATAAPASETIDLFDLSDPVVGTGWSFGGGVLTLFLGEHVVTTTGQQTTNRIVAGSDVHVILDDVNIRASTPFDVTGAAGVRVTVENENHLTALDGPGMSVGAGDAVTIDGPGRLAVSGSTTCSGIGGGSNSSYAGCSGSGGTVVVNGGTITVVSGTSGGAAIGGGGTQSGGGTVTINGGSVTATSSSAAGIGGGGGGNGAAVTINGGTVQALSMSGGPGIGAGLGGTSQGSITINGGSVRAALGAAPVDAQGRPVYRHALTLGNPPVGDGVRVADCTFGAVVCDLDGVPLAGYGVWDVRTIDGGIVYVYLPSAQGTHANWVKAGGVFYGATFAHTANGDDSHVLTETSWPSAPVVTSVTARRVALAAIDGAEYAVGQTQSWQALPTFAGLTPDTEYVFYARYAASDGVPASFVSPPLVVRTASTAALEAAIAVATPLRQADYTPGSWAVVQVLLGQATTALAADSAGQAQIDQMTEALVAACDAVVPRGDPSGLAAVVGVADGLTPSDYTPESWSALAEALEAALAVLGDPLVLVETGQDEVDVLLAALTAAIDGLTVVPAQASVLEALVATVDGYTSDGFTEASWSLFDAAREVARTLLADPTGALASQIAAAVADLEAATDALVRVVGTGGLDGAIASARAAIATMAPADYTGASWGALVASLARAETARQAAGADQLTQAAADAVHREVDAAAEDLAAALGGLIADRAGLDAAITAVEAAGLKPADYTAPSWSA
ncbi:MAG: FIVAR domain-containing protein, partial [Bifidobacteriaceae bacterium]|nr:FIVAR domain-containing protein [Bifidobacteriaceae bacterium]